MGYCTFLPRGYCQVVEIVGCCTVAEFKHCFKEGQ